MGAEPSRARSWLAVGVRVLFAGAVVAWLIAAGAGHASQLRHVHLRPRPAWLLLAAPATLSGGLLLPLGWRALLRAYDTSIPAKPAVRTWTLAAASRYLPTGLFAVASRVVLAARLGVSRSVTVWTAVVEFGLLVVSGATLAAALLPAHTLAMPLKIAGTVGGVAALGVTPLVLDRLGGLAGRWRQTALTARPAAGPAYEAIAMYVLNTAVRSAGALFVVAALVHLRAGDVWLIVGASNAAAVAGLVGITPAGLGVREAVLATLLSPRFGLGDAAAVAVALRAWDFGCDLVWLFIAAVVLRGAAAEPVNAAGGLSPADPAAVAEPATSGEGAGTVP